MAKFAVLFVAALVFQAAFAGVRRHYDYHDHHEHHDHHGHDSSYETFAVGVQSGQLQILVGQVQSVANDISEDLQGNFHSQQLAKTLIWQSRELVQIIENIVSRLQDEIDINGGELQQVVSELREILASFLKLTQYTDLTNVAQLKTKFNVYLQNAVEQIVNLVRLVQIDVKEPQGSLYTNIKNVMVEFLKVMQNVKAQTECSTLKMQGQSPKLLAIQIQEVTSGLISVLQRDSDNPQVVKTALHEYVQEIEAIISKLQGQVTVGNSEIVSAVQQLSNKLRQLLQVLIQMVESEITVGFNELKLQLIRELQSIVLVVDQLIQVGQVGPQETPAKILVQDILALYLSAIQQLRTKIVKMNEAGIYGQSGYQSEFFGKQGDLYGKSGLYGQDRLYKPYGMSGFSDYQGDLYGKSSIQGGLYGMYGKHEGLYGKNAVYGKAMYPGNMHYGMSGMGLTVQVREIVSELTMALQSQHDSQVLLVQVRHFAQIVETIIDHLQEEVSGNDVMIHQIIAKLREIQMEIKRTIAYNTLVGVAQLKVKFTQYVEEVATEIEKLASAAQETPAISNVVVKNVVSILVSGIRNILLQLQGHQYGSQYGIQELYDKGYGYGHDMYGLQGLHGTEGVHGLEGLRGLEGLGGLEGIQGRQGFGGLEDFNGFQGLHGDEGVQGLHGLQNFQDAVRPY